MRHATDTRWTLQDAMECFTPGERWAYKEPNRRKYLEAEIHSIPPDAKPVRVRVILYDDGFEVARKAVPCGRLKFPWTEIDQVRDMESKLRRLSKPTREEDRILKWCFQSDSSPHWRFSDQVSWAIVVLDEEGLANEYGFELADVRDPSGFDSEDGPVVGWAVLEKMVRFDLMRDDAAVAKAIVEHINFDRRWAMETRQQWQAESPWLEEEIYDRYLNLSYTDELSDGLQILCPDLYEVQRYEDARYLVRVAVELAVDLRRELETIRGKRRYDELDRRLTGLRSQYAVLGLESDGRPTVQLKVDLPTTEAERLAWNRGERNHP